MYARVLKNVSTGLPEPKDETGRITAGCLHATRIDAALFLSAMSA